MLLPFFSCFPKISESLRASKYLCTVRMVPIGKEIFLFDLSTLVLSFFRVLDILKRN